MSPLLSFFRFWAKLITTGPNGASLWFQTQTGRWARVDRARHSGGARRNCGSMGAVRHTPTEENAPKHSLILLATSPSCQVNGWASDSTLCIPHCSFSCKVLLWRSLHGYRYTHCHSVEYREFFSVNETDRAYVK